MAFGGRGIKPVDYSQLLSQAQEHRHAAQQQAKKLKALSKQGQFSREAWFLRLHQGVWQHEWSRLVTEGLRVERQLEQWRVDTLLAAHQGLGTGSNAGQIEGAGQQVDMEWIVEIMTYTMQLQHDMKTFEKDALNALRQLQVDLKNWVNCPEAERGHVPQCTDLQARCESAKKHLHDMEADLQDEYMRLWCDLKEFDGAGGRRDEVCSAVSAVLLESKCPNPTLWASLMAEFHLLNQHYQLMLHTLQKKHLGYEYSQLSDLSWILFPMVLLIR